MCQSGFLDIGMLGHWDATVNGTDKIPALRGLSLLFSYLVVKKIWTIICLTFCKRRYLRKTVCFREMKSVILAGNFIFCALKLGLMEDEDHGLVLITKDNTFLNMCYHLPACGRVRHFLKNTCSCRYNADLKEKAFSCNSLLVGSIKRAEE